MPGRDDGADLCAWLADRHTHSDASVWAERLTRGELVIDGVIATATGAVRAGQQVVWNRPPWHEPDVPRDYSLCHVDADLIAVNKPSGLPTMPAGGFLDHTLMSLLRATYPEVSPMHRLGRGTSGVVLFGRTPHARVALQAAWRAGEVEKIYRARIAGSPDWDERVVDVPIGPVPHERLGTLHAASPTGRPARSVARVLRRDEGSTLVEVSIDTGRPHQIRIHMATTGHPLLGDPLYGPGGSARDDALPGDLGYALHAASLGFVHPSTGARLTVSAPPPAALT